MVTSQGWSKAFADPFGGAQLEPPAASDGWPHRGWTGAGQEPTVFLCDNQLHIVAELRVASANVTDALSQPTEATFTIATEGVDAARLEPWKSTVVVVVDGEPVWGGTIVKHRMTLGRTATEVVCREWSAWLGRVWTTAVTEWGGVADPDPVDAGWLLHQRYTSAIALHASTVIPAPALRPGSTFMLEGAEFPDQTDEASPQSVLAEIDSIAQQGVEWRHEWEWNPSNNQIDLYLRCSVYNPASEPADWVVGLDVADATVAVDSDEQATVVAVRGADDLVAEDGVVSDLPLWKVLSFDKVGSVDEVKGQQRLIDIAASVLKQVKQPTVTASDVSSPVLRSDVRAGDMVRLIVPTDYDPRFPDGLSMLLRVSQVVWEWSAGSGTTRVTLTTPWENYANVPVVLGTAEPPALGKADSLPTVLRDLQKRMVSVEARRTPAPPARYSLTAHTHSQYAPLASPTFTGTPAAPTAVHSTSTTQIATTDYVRKTHQIDGVAAANTDWNTILDPGPYRYLLRGSTGEHLNGPTPNVYFYLTVYAYSSSGNVTQVAYSYTGDVAYMRNRYSSAWTAWTPLGGAFAASTGWRDISGWVSSNYAVQSGAKVVIKRDGDIVQMLIGQTRRTSAAAGNLAVMTLPTGFRHSANQLWSIPEFTGRFSNGGTTYQGSLYLWGTSLYAVIRVSGGGFNTTLYADLAQNWDITGALTFPTADAWPSSLPGTATTI